MRKNKYWLNFFFWVYNLMINGINSYHVYIWYPQTQKGHLLTLKDLRNDSKHSKKPHHSMTPLHGSTPIQVLAYAEQTPTLWFSKTTLYMKQNDTCWPSGSGGVAV